MNTEVTVHHVSIVELTTKKGDTAQWLQIRVFNRNGEQELDLTLFANGGKAITLKLGEEE